MGGGAYGSPGYIQPGSGRHGTTAQWVAVIVSVIALFVGGYGVFLANGAQDRANHIAQQSNHIAQKNDELQKQLQAQNQAANARSSAEQVVLTTDPAEYSADQSVQGVIIDNGTHKLISNITVLFTTGSKHYISDRAYYPSLAPCTYMTLSFDSSFSTPADWDAWIYFTDADGNVWLTDLFGNFQKATSVPPEGQSVTDELTLSSSSLTICGQ
jgi:hypothetical protein